MGFFDEIKDFGGDVVDFATDNPFAAFAGSLGVANIIETGGMAKDIFGDFFGGGGGAPGQAPDFALPQAEDFQMQPLDFSLFEQFLGEASQRGREVTRENIAESFDIAGRLAPELTRQQVGTCGIRSQNIQNR